MRVSITVPTAEPGGKVKTGESTVEGVKVGPFVVHRTIGGRGYFTISHIKTAYAVRRKLTESSAFNLAHELADHDWWEFDDSAAVKSWPETHPGRLEQLREIFAEYGA